MNVAECFQKGAESAPKVLGAKVPKVPERLAKARGRGRGRPRHQVGATRGGGQCAWHPQEVVTYYREWMDGVRSAPPDWRHDVASLRAALPQLRGRDLMCWCGPEDLCHADV